MFFLKKKESKYNRIPRIFENETLKLNGDFFLFNWNLKANNILGNQYHTYGVSSAFCQQTYPSYCKRESVYPMPEQTFTFSLGYDF